MRVPYIETVLKKMVNLQKKPIFGMLLFIFIVGD